MNQAGCLFSLTANVVVWPVFGALTVGDFFLATPLFAQLLQTGG
jgi:hypothetical protein